MQKTRRKCCLKLDFSQVWTFPRFIPIPIEDQILDPNDEFWQMLLLVHEVVNLVCAPKCTEEQFAYMGILIKKYLDIRVTYFQIHHLDKSTIFCLIIMNCTYVLAHKF